MIDKIIIFALTILIIGLFIFSGYNLGRKSMCNEEGKLYSFDFDICVSREGLVKASGK